MPASLFKTKQFIHFARRECISDRSLAKVIARVGRGFLDTDLGGGLIKQRGPREGLGRKGGYQMLVAYEVQRRAVFLYGFAHREKDSIDPDQMSSFQEIAAAWLAANQAQIEAAIKALELQEVTDEEPKD
jgi:hypothetical protein